METTMKKENFKILFVLHYSSYLYIGKRCVFMINVSLSERRQKICLHGEKAKGYAYMEGNTKGRTLLEGRMC